MTGPDLFRVSRASPARAAIKRLLALRSSTSSKSASTTFSSLAEPWSPASAPAAPASSAPGAPSACLRLVERLAELHQSLQSGPRSLPRSPSTSSPSFTAFSSAERLRSAALSSAETLSPASFSCFSVVWISASAWFLASTSFLRFLSSAACGFGVLDHLLDVGVGQAARGLDADLLLLAGGLVLRRDVDDAVGVDVEGDLDLRHAARRRRNADQVELAERACCRRPFRARPGRRGWSTAVWLSSAVEKIWLFLVGIVVLRSIRRVNTPPRVSMPSDSGVTSSSSTSLTSPFEHAALDGRADGDDFVRVHALVRLACRRTPSPSR